MKKTPVSLHFLTKKKVGTTENMTPNEKVSVLGTKLTAQCQKSQPKKKAEKKRQ